MSNPSLPVKFPLFAAIVCALFLGGIYFSIELTPVERYMGIIQKVYYIHLAGAISMAVCATLCGVMSMLYLVAAPGSGSSPTAFQRMTSWLYERRLSIDAIALTAAEIATALGIAVCTTGPLWARKAWGIFWRWEPRLTLTLVLLVIYFSYFLIRRFQTEAELSRKLAAGLGVIAFIDAWFIRYSVKLWGGLHPMIQSEHPMIYYAKIIMIVVMVLFVFLLGYVRYTVLSAQSRIEGIHSRLINLDMST